MRSESTLKKCRNFMTPTAEFSPATWHWHDRIYAYMDLLQARIQQVHEQREHEEKGQKKGHQKPSRNPADLSGEEIQNTLRYYRIKASDLGR